MKGNKRKFTRQELTQTTPAPGIEIPGKKEKPDVYDDETKTFEPNLDRDLDEIQHAEIMLVHISLKQKNMLMPKTLTKKLKLK